MEKNISKPIRARFAPSPTGYVHVGSLRTVLFNFLFTKHNQGTHVLRIEDTDQSRFVPGATENLISVLSQLGITFDEGPYINEHGDISEKGDFGPYVQSKRKELGIYEKYTKELINSKNAYYCFCTEERLEEVRKEQTALKKPPMYDRLCRNLSDEEIHKKLEQFQTENKRPVVRQAMPLDGQTKIHDLVYGDIIIENKILDDQVLLKSDGFPTYHLAVVVDDHLMEISHVIRGPEWIASTPKHILLYKAFNWEPTEFAHIPLVLNPDKTKLSKRQGDVAVEDFLKKGYLKDSLLNFIAFLGWNPKTEQEIFTLPELIEQFDLSKINKAGAVFDIDKLDWINGVYIRSKSNEELLSLIKPYWQSAGFIKSGTGPVTDDSGNILNDDFLTGIIILEKERLKKLSEIGERTSYFFKDPEPQAEMLVWKKSSKDETRNILEKLLKLIEGLELKSFSRELIEIEIKKFISDNSLDNGTVLWPLRVALTGMQASPGPFDVLSTLFLGYGKEVVLKRLKKAIDQLI
jgi:glutamyl-tRNA synthetase